MNYIGQWTISAKSINKSGGIHVEGVRIQIKPEKVPLRRKTWREDQCQPYGMRAGAFPAEGTASAKVLT